MQVIDTIKLKDIQVVVKKDYVEYQEDPGVQYWDEWSSLECVMEVNGKEFSAHNVDLTTFFLDDNKKTSDWIWGLKNRDESGFSQQEKASLRKVDQGLISEDYLDSCSCGHAGCNGYWTGVLIKRKKHHFIYQAPINMGYNRIGILGSGKLSLKVKVEDILTIRDQLSKVAKEASPNGDIISTLYEIMGDNPAPTRSWVVNTK